MGTQGTFPLPTRTAHLFASNPHATGRGSESKGESSQLSTDWAVLELTRSRSSVSVRFVAGAVLGRLHLSGNASSPYAGAADDRFVASPSLGITTRFFSS